MSFRFSLTFVLLATFACTLFAPAHAAEDPPNVVLIMVDDMGWSDLGCYGGEIETPHLDRLATEGIRFTQFYNCAKCETSRAALISGRYAPEVGIAKLQNCRTIAQRMRDAGYTTLMTGKWHLSGNPVDFGFDRYFGHLSGATNFFHGDNTFRLDDKPFEVPREGFYTTDADTDYAIEFLEEADDDRPVFLYIAYNAPHYPLHVPQEDFEKYRGRYRDGWDHLREQRLARVRQLGLLPEPFALPPRPEDVPAWDSLTDDQRDTQELMMAAYAGMIDRVDQNIGRLREALEKQGRFENTLFLFLSDNGACPFQRTKQKTLENQLMPWDPESYWTYDKGWAHACNTPFREYKRNQHEGGICTPLIAHWPAGISRPGRITSQPGQIVDLLATCIDVAGVDREDARAEAPLRGQSLKPIFEGQQRTPHDAIYFTFYGTHNALRVGDWKLVNIDRGPWELYNLAEDRTELHDRAGTDPERLQELRTRFEAMRDEIGTGRSGRRSKKSN
ncbi:Arylsulfatase [Maioricimonas rarisocia]|uniref:Arylsulfatase n=1 Tax=Maioricimonas rarisocia TaxID=2528026 RepID=A0A517ZBC7_9PLAN|nr:arylsulfatase [Maioricimonas rarisocia]QDU39739.1 Arylsulfatase [Maioricimonas rarisocia]